MVLDHMTPEVLPDLSYSMIRKIRLSEKYLFSDLFVEISFLQVIASFDVRPGMVAPLETDQLKTGGPCCKIVLVIVSLTDWYFLGYGTEIPGGISHS